MALEMKTACQKCEGALSDDKFAFICTYECTFCQECTHELNFTCPNCGGELTTRPRRFPKA